MTALSTHPRTELAHRSSDGEDKVVVCVCDRWEGAYFEIPAEPHLALTVYYHPFAYGLENRRLPGPSPRDVAR